jgi:hypothetical protein
MRFRTLLVAPLIVAAMVAAPGLAQAKDQERPVKGGLAVGVEVPYRWVAFTPPTVRSVSDVTVPTPHLGLASWHEEDTMVLTGPASGFYWGHGSITAANGDLVYYDALDGWLGPNPDRPGTFLTGGTNVITGGTGRFAAATGQLDFEGVIIPTGPGVGYMDLQMSGWISY